ncbi:MAG: 50S ribosomal protein L10 [Hyphomicrobiales bacterium]
MDRARKQELVASLNTTFKDVGTVVVTHNLGLTVAQMTDLRIRMAEEGASLKVAKNRLVKLALEGTDAEGITDLFSGPTVLAYSEDPVSAAKVVAKFAKENDKLVVLGGAMGSTVLDVAGVKALADLPSLDELRAKLVGMIQTPATRIAGIMQAPGGQVARVLNAYASKGEAA